MLTAGNHTPDKEVTMAVTRATQHVPTFNSTIFAHRGLPSRAPENTLAAFDLAADEGATWIETDVDIIADGTPIIIHDTALDRTTDHRGKLYDIATAEELAGIDAGSWFAPEFASERVITLDALVDLLNRRKLNANIEIKANEQGAERTIVLVDAIASSLARLDPEREIIISSFSQPVLMTFHARHPEYAIGVLYETVALYDDWLSVLELCGASYIHPEDAGLTRERVQAFRDAGYGVNVWTVDSRDRANELLNWGATGVFTNIADQLIR